MKYLKKWEKQVKTASTLSLNSFTVKVQVPLFLFPMTLHSHTHLGYSVLKDIFNLCTFPEGMYFQCWKAIIFEVG